MNKPFLHILTISLLVMGVVGCSVETPASEGGRVEAVSKGIDLLSEEVFPQWTQKGGQAVFELKDGVLTGTSRPNTQNSFICPPKRYENFELQFEVKSDPRLNSGVQIRSSDDLKDMNDKMPMANQERIAEILGKQARMFGPQVEIAANGNAGGVWFEVGRGWLSKANKEKVETIYKKDGWNHYKIMANGPRIQVYINGEKITDFVDDVTHMAEGYLGFQVHSVSYPDPSHVHWRNITLNEFP